MTSLLPQTPLEPEQRDAARVGGLRAVLAGAGRRPAALLLLGDPTRMRQVPITLVGNAIKFTGRGGVTIRADYAPAGDRPTFTLEVQDTGLGIPEEKRQPVFQHLAQADSSNTRNHGGTGLELAITITRQLVELMGGTIELESEVGKGSTFRVMLPLAAAKPDEAAAAVPPEIQRAEAGRSRVPIAAVTANPMDGDRQRCLESGMGRLSERR